MKVFISWSGAKSRYVAEAMRTWLGDVLVIIEPWVSSEDIAKGARWGVDVAQRLEESRFGILCVTRENMNEPWLLFEAGALAKTLAGALVCPYLVDLKPTDLQGPLVQFQAARAVEADTRALVHSINNALAENARPKEMVDRAFKKWWPDLDAVLRNMPQTESSARDIRSEREILEEILVRVRATEGRAAVPGMPDWLARFTESGGGLFSGSDIDSLAIKLRSCGQEDDPNASPWAHGISGQRGGTLDGYWGSRWGGGRAKPRWVTGIARVETHRDNVYFLHKDPSADCFIVCRRLGDSDLLGRWLNLAVPEESTPWVGRIVTADRIDGFWGDGRWDLQRISDMSS